MKQVTIVLLGIVLSFFVCAQEKQGRLIGSVVDSSKKSLRYATISLSKPDHPENFLKTSYSDIKGHFQFNADTGKYILSISHVGYPDTRIPVHIQPGDNLLDTIFLNPASSRLQTVTVTVRKPLIEQGEDRITYNVESDPAAKSETATDLLRKTPLVTVDGDGNVQLNGQSNFKILLNGRETSMFAQNVKDALKNFPGAVISKIEVITSPSAKYDAEGVGGIINIITKKKVVGYNGYVSSYFSTLSNYSQSASLNLKTGKVGLSAYYGTNGSFNNIEGQSYSQTIPFTTLAFSNRTINGNRASKNIGDFGNVEATYDLDSFNTIALYSNIGKFRSVSQMNQTILTEHGQQSADQLLFLQNNTSLNPNWGIGTDFIRKYRDNPDKELNFRFNGQFSKNDLDNNSYQGISGKDRFISNKSLSLNREYTLQIDYSQPLSNKQKLETGAKGILRNASSDFQSLVKYNAADEFEINPLNSDRFNYHQEVYSLYGSYSFPIKKYSFRVGLRGEHTDVHGDFISSQTVVSQSYTSLVPNFLVTKKFSDLYTLSFSYNLRLQRPYITSLNPFVNNADSLNISYGNPMLGPQYTHQVLFQNRFVKGKFFASLTLTASYTNTMIVQYQSFNQQTGVTTTTSANAGKETYIGGSLSINTPLGKKINFGMNSMLRYNHIENKLNPLYQNEGMSGLLVGFFNYKVIGSFTISGSGGVVRNNYTLLTSPGNNSFYQVNFGYKFLKEKLSATINFNNFHRKYFSYYSTTNNPAFRTTSINTYPYRVTYLGVTYNFGKLKEQVSKKKGVSNDDLVQ